MAIFVPDINISHQTGR